MCESGRTRQRNASRSQISAGVESVLPYLYFTPLQSAALLLWGYSLLTPVWQIVKISTTDFIKVYEAHDVPNALDEVIFVFLSLAPLI